MRVDLDLIHREAPEPLYGQLASLLRGAIHTGVYKPGEQLEPWRTFMKKGSLSYPTVARAVSDLAEEGLLASRGGAGTFVVDRLPKIERKIKKIGIYYYRLDTPSFEQIYAGIEQECRLNGIEPILHETGFEPAGDVQALHHFREVEVDGIIAMPLARPSMQRDLTTAIHQDENIVIVNMRVPQLPCDAIELNYEQAGLLLARHLLKRHHRRIAVFGSQLLYPNTRNWQVFTGIKRAFLERGWPMPESIPQYLVAVNVDEDDPGIMKNLRTLIRPKDEPSPTALICTSCRLAHLALKSFNLMNINCPADLSLACIGEECDVALLDPPLTAITTPLARLGSEAVRRLIDRFNHPNSIPVHMVLDVGIAIRQSTDDAPPAQTDAR